MKAIPKPSLAPRKAPKQRRSATVVESILAAATQVLASEGAKRFTTARVADRAGVSVGSLYQYFPSKEAILYRLQLTEWEQTGGLIASILADTSTDVYARLREMVVRFVASECEEAEMRRALGDAAPLYRAAPEAEQFRIAGMEAVDHFIAEALPNQNPDMRRVTGEVIMTAIGAIGKRVSDQQRSLADIDALSSATADMCCTYLRTLAEEAEPV